MMGSAIVRRLVNRVQPRESIICRSHDELDLIDQSAVRAFFSDERSGVVYLAAASMRTTASPAGFSYQNLTIQANVIHEAFAADVPKLLFLGSTYIYPRLAAQPMPEVAFLGGPHSSLNLTPTELA